ncbi:MAG: hypothetical protein MUC50_00480 [Myxococcota bacterium]|jgi:hypothetical protein|nr:hypothetical protein [Myxococcota bacterium]
MTTPATLTRLEKVAADNGFDLPGPHEGDWLHFSSTQVPLNVWLMALGDNLYLAAFSQKNVSLALDDLGSPMVSPMPKGAVGLRSVPSIPALHHLSSCRGPYPPRSSMPTKPARPTCPSLPRSSGSWCSE